MIRYGEEFFVKKLNKYAKRAPLLEQGTARPLNYNCKFLRESPHNLVKIRWLSHTQLNMQK